MDPALPKMSEHPCRVTGMDGDKATGAVNQQERPDVYDIAGEHLRGRATAGCSM